MHGQKFVDTRSDHHSPDALVKRPVLKPRALTQSRSSPRTHSALHSSGKGSLARFRSAAVGICDRRFIVEIFGRRGGPGCSQSSVSSRRCSVGLRSGPCAGRASSSTSVQPRRTASSWSWLCARGRRRAGTGQYRSVPAKGICNATSYGDVLYGGELLNVYGNGLGKNQIRCPHTFRYIL